MSIEIKGLNEKQKVFADIIWDAESLDEIEYFIDSLMDPKDKADALALVEIIAMDIAEQDGRIEELAPYVNDLLNDIMEKE